MKKGMEGSYKISSSCVQIIFQVCAKELLKKTVIHSFVQLI